VTQLGEKVWEYSLTVSGCKEDLEKVVKASVSSPANRELVGARGKAQTGGGVTCSVGNIESENMERPTTTMKEGLQLIYALALVKPVSVV